MSCVYHFPLMARAEYRMNKFLGQHLRDPEEVLYKDEDRGGDVKVTPRSAPAQKVEMGSNGGGSGSIVSRGNGVLSQEIVDVEDESSEEEYEDEDGDVY